MDKQWPYPGTGRQRGKPPKKRLEIALCAIGEVIFDMHKTASLDVDGNMPVKRSASVTISRDRMLSNLFEMSNFSRSRNIITHPCLNFNLKLSMGEELYPV